MSVDGALAAVARQGKWRAFAIVFVLVWILYFTSNQQTVWPAHPLPLTPVDRLTPLLPWTGWIYSLIYLFPLLPAALAREGEEVDELVRAFVAMTAMCSAAFFLFPTAYPRPPMPLDGTESVTLTVVRLLDTPRNCFPSQHVAAAFLSALFARRHGKALGAASFALAAAISVSTLTTKQHYLWDVIAGFAVACAAYRWGVSARPAVRSAGGRGTAPFPRPARSDSRTA